MGKVLICPEYDSIDGPLIFLAGPIQGSEDWQSRAIKLITDLSDIVNIASPRRNERCKGEFSGFKYDEQVDWETYHLQQAGLTGCILFWLAKEKNHRCDRAYAQTTRAELFEWKTKHQIFKLPQLVVGIEHEFTGEKYIRRRFGQDCPEVPIVSSLEYACALAVNKCEAHKQIKESAQDVFKKSLRDIWKDYYY